MARSARAGIIRVAKQVVWQMDTTWVHFDISIGNDVGRGLRFCIQIDCQIDGAVKGVGRGLVAKKVSSGSLIDNIQADDDGIDGRQRRLESAEDVLTFDQWGWRRLTVGRGGGCRLEREG